MWLVYCCRQGAPHLWTSLWYVLLVDKDGGGGGDDDGGSVVVPGVVVSSFVTVLLSDVSRLLANIETVGITIGVILIATFCGCCCGGDMLCDA